LLLDLFGDELFGCGFKTAGVDQEERVILIKSLGIVPIAGHARFIFDNGLAPFDQTIKEGGFPHVGPAYNGNNWFHRIFATEVTKNSEK
jgi:hypothetical protein